MSDDPRRSAPPQAATSGTDPLREIRHDLRHSLYVLDLALTLLADSRTDAARFSELMQMLRNEQTTISRLVEELLARASAIPSGTSTPQDRENSAT